MTSLSIPALRCGGPANLPYSTILQAGPLSMLLEQGELRRIRAGSQEIVRRIYTSLRGPDWATIPARLLDLKIEANPNSFRIAYQLVHKKEEFDFTWSITIEGTEQGKIHFEARGLAAQAFSTNRASLCVLHPLIECIGQAVRTADAEGQVKAGMFPKEVIPHQAFIGFQTFEYDIEPGISARLKYVGEDFEMEDQRNWSDGSFKTYSPPQSKPKPRQVVAGEEIVQSVTLEVAFSKSWVAPELSQPIRLSPSLSPLRRLPDWGFSLPSHGQKLGPTDIHRIKALGPKHLRANFIFSLPGVNAALTQAVEEAGLLDVPLEAALFLPPLMARKSGRGDLEIPSLEQILGEFSATWKDLGACAIRWLIFIQNQDTLPSEIFERVKFYLKPLAPSAAFVVGSRDDFVLLNRNRITILNPDSDPLKIPPANQESEICFVLTPQVHLFDNRTLMEALQGQAWILETVQKTWPDRNMNVTPITLKRTPLAMALKKGFAQHPEALWKTQVEPRQFSLLGAAWTLATLINLLKHGAEKGISATFYELTGLLGVLSGERLDPESLNVPGTDFKMDRSWVFPLFHVFADFAEYANLEGSFGQAWISNSPLSVQGICLSHGQRKSLLVANLEEKPMTTHFNGLAGIQRIRRLNELNAMTAMAEPELYRTNSFEKLPIHATDNLSLEFLPFEFVRIDFE